MYVSAVYNILIYICLFIRYKYIYSGIKRLVNKEYLILIVCLHFEVEEYLIVCLHFEIRAK